MRYHERAVAMLEIAAEYALAPRQIVAARYRLDSVIGEGGMGVVWAATHVLTEKPCALKFIKAARAADPKNHERLLHEARAACKVRHPNVAQVHDILELESGVPFIVMDLLEGEPLSRRLAARGRFNLHETARILIQIVDAVAAAHALGIVHRDLKPDNVFLERGLLGRDIVKILDFGIAKNLGVGIDAAPLSQGARASHGLTTTHSMIGTPLYMAPEQLRQGGAVDGRADIWSIGVIAYECLVGGRPDRSEDTSGISESAFARLDARDPALPPDARELVAHLLETNRATRATLDEAHRILIRYAGENGDLARSQDGVMSASIAPSHTPRSRVRIPRVASVAAAAVGAAALAFFASTARRAPDLAPAAEPAPRSSAMPVAKNTVPSGVAASADHVDAVPPPLVPSTPPLAATSSPKPHGAAPRDTARPSRARPTGSASASATSTTVAEPSATLSLKPRETIPSYERE